MQVSKGTVLKLANAILTTTGCRELCRQCATTDAGTDIGLDGKIYGKSRHGCCDGCNHLGPNGCNIRGHRALTCTFYTCEIICRRLREFGLEGWFRKVGKSAGWLDFRDPKGLKRTYPIHIPFREFKGTKLEKGGGGVS